MSTETHKSSAEPISDALSAADEDKAASQKVIEKSPDERVNPSKKPIRIRRRRKKELSRRPELEVQPQVNGADGEQLNSNPTIDDNHYPSVITSHEKTETNLDLFTPNSRRIVECHWQHEDGHICSESIPESKIANHIRWCHLEPLRRTGDEEPPTGRNHLHCEVCGRYYSSKYVFEKHARTHTEGPLKCQECESTFATDYSLIRHRAKFHSASHNFTERKCDRCDDIFFSASELALHQRRHTNEKTIECPDCDKKFSTKGNLKIHTRTHSREKNYMCDYCDATFTHSYSLVIHRRRHTDLKPFKCQQCFKQFVSKHQLVSHSNVHRKENAFQCDRCTKTFRSRTAFKGHQDFHDGIKRYSCSVCKRKFQCKANQVKHERRHQGIKAHKCSMCDSSFFEQQELRNHLKIHNRDL